MPQVHTPDGRRSEPVRVIVADADADTRSLYTEILRESGCDVVEARDGREALTEAVAGPLSLLVTELRLPHVDGLELCERLRGGNATRTTPILVVTADARPDALDRVRAAGADMVFVKPCEPALLLQEITRLVDRAHGVRQQQ